MKLHLSSSFTIPQEAVTSTFAIFGKRGSGKTNTAVVLAEEMFKAGLRFVILDPLGVWWGLKSSFDGKKAGLGVYVFGGEHGDLPLEPTAAAGVLVADVLIQQQLSLVLDMKGWSNRDRAEFSAAFAERLLAHNKEPLHVFLEEADAFVPQRPFKGEEVMLGRFDRLVRWGRSSGLGTTLITQRSAKVNKDVTTQAETLIAHRITGPQDRDAIDAWIKYHAGDEKRLEILESLPTLKNGECWLWSPEWLGKLERVMVRRRETYDSAATPKVGEKRPEPKKLSQVDVDALKSQMASTIERAKESDPKELKRKIAELEKKLKERPAEQKVVEKKVEVPLLKDAQLDKALKLVERLDGFTAKLQDVFVLACKQTDDLKNCDRRSSPRHESATPGTGAGACPIWKRRVPANNGNCEPSYSERRIWHGARQVDRRRLLEWLSRNHRPDAEDPGRHRLVRKHRNPGS